VVSFREGTTHNREGAFQSELQADRPCRLTDAASRMTLAGMANVSPNLDDLYVVLRSWAVAKQTHTYTELSHEYQARTNDWFEPHRSWDAPLGALNQRLHQGAGAPALSALVVLAESREPGGGFWGSAPSVPPRPKNDIERLSVWTSIVKAVHAFPWPLSLP
jgi:hypothetical protein